jgi:hypothetical protein
VIRKNQEDRWGFYCAMKADGIIFYYKGTDGIIQDHENGWDYTGPRGLPDL